MIDTSSIEQVFKDIADHTVGKCGQCMAPNACCSRSACEDTREFAMTYFEVALKETDHPNLPFMGESGCTVAPHLRPICSVHVCERHFGYDAEWVNEYWRLREKADEVLSALLDRDDA